jgi:eukaryotic-like serine/threonine-protein kinase
VKGFKAFFENLFTDDKPANAGGRSLGGANSADRPRPAPAGPGMPAGNHRPVPEAAYKKGDVIGGKYEIYGLLGRGGFGEVYLVYSLQLSDALALKTFRQEFLANAEAKDNFKREALVWMKLDQHPFILAMRFVDEFSGRLFVGMEFIAPDDRGRVSLADHLAHARGPLDTNQVIEWAIMFCHGMEHANRRGIKCHRDIKPANILIRQDGTLLISDFGLAAAVETARRDRADLWQSVGEEAFVGLSLLQTEGKQVCGTPGYLAPEVFRGKGAEVRSDIYSFGLVLWQMAAGSKVPPFSLGVAPPRDPRDIDRYALDIYKRQMRERAPALGEPLEAVLARCLAPDPSARYESFRELRAELDAVLRQRSGRSVEVPTIYVWRGLFWTNKGQSLMSLGRYDEAAACFKKALEIQPADEHPELAAAKTPEVTAAVPLAHHGLGLALHRKGDIDGAIAEYRIAIRFRTDDAAAHANLGSALKAKGDIEGAIAEYRTAIRLRPDLGGAHANLAAALGDKGDLEGAIGEYHTAIRLEPDMALAHANLATALADKGNLDGAITEYRTTIRLQPDNASAHSNLGLALRDKGNLDGAITEYHTALRLQPDLAAAHYNLGLALQAKGDLDGAVAEYRSSIRLQPDYAAAHSDLGLALYAKRDVDGAIAEYRAAIRLDSRLAAAHSNLGAALYVKRDVDGAIAEYRAAIRLEPDLALAHYNLGLALNAKGDLVGAITEYRAATRLQPDYADAHHNLGNALLQLYDLEGAIAEYRAAIRLQPDYADAHRNLDIALRFKGRS